MRKRKTREEKWDELEKAFQKQLDEARKRALLADSFAELEEIAGQVGRELERALLGAMAEQQEPAGRPDCPGCGARMYRRGRKKRQLKTSQGEVEVERERWVCPVCGSGLFPP